MCFLLVLAGMPVDVCKANWSIVSFKTTFALMIFCLHDLSIDLSWVLKFLVTIVLSSVLPLYLLVFAFYT